MWGKCPIIGVVIHIIITDIIVLTQASPPTWNTPSSSSPAPLTLDSTVSTSCNELTELGATATDGSRLTIIVHSQNPVGGFNTGTNGNGDDILTCNLATILAAAAATYTVVVRVTQAGNMEFADLTLIITVTGLATSTTVTTTDCTQIGTQCNGIPNAFCDLNLLKCKCDIGYAQDPAATSACILVIGALVCNWNGVGTDPCTQFYLNSECTLATAINSVCRCKAGYVLNRRGGCAEMTVCSGFTAIINTADISVGVGATVDFNTVKYDGLGEYLSGVFTPKANGLYCIHLQIMVNALKAQYVTVKKGGIRFVHLYASAKCVKDFRSASGFWCVNLAMGETVNVVGSTYGGSNGQIHGGGHSSFSVIKADC